MVCFDGSSAFAEIGTGEWGLPRNHYFCHREGASFTTGAFAFHTVLELHTPVPSFFLVPFSFMSFLDRCSKVVEYQSVVFPDWDRGASWMREVARMPAGLRPASCRLGCNLFLAIQNVSWKEWRIKSRAEWHPTFQEAQRVQNTNSTDSTCRTEFTRICADFSSLMCYLKLPCRDISASLPVAWSPGWWTKTSCSWRRRSKKALNKVAPGTHSGQVCEMLSCLGKAQQSKALKRTYPKDSKRAKWLRGILQTLGALMHVLVVKSNWLLQMSFFARSPKELGYWQWRRKRDRRVFAGSSSCDLGIWRQSSRSESAEEGLITCHFVSRYMYRRYSNQSSHNLSLVFV